MKRLWIPLHMDCVYTLIQNFDAASRVHSRHAGANLYGITAQPFATRSPKGCAHWRYKASPRPLHVERSCEVDV
jgi:hypothetical protein